ncbi:hypothetical protein [uncultured Ilyobacter sp.]|uniref:hypothetical protein n=1 Tax=uncultured Ilyobacter sp. TaxID=544433 RepID=UPI0029C0E7DD|nr:hypothetical protein [uncultured Ilyobacter sp.]
MKKLLVGALIFGSSIAYGSEITNDFLVKGHVGRAFVEFDDADVEGTTSYGAEFEYLRGISGERFHYGAGLGITNFDWEDDLDFMAYEIYGTMKYMDEEGYFVQAKAGFADGGETVRYSSTTEGELELTGFMFGASCGREWENRVSLEVGVKTYDTEATVRTSSGNAKDDAWQHYWYVGLGYKL